MSLYSFSRSVLRAFLTVGYGWRAYGLENVPQTGSVILAGNHTSYLDPPLIIAAVDRHVHFMAKAELFKIPVFGSILRRVQTFPVRRGAADRSAIRSALELLEKGEAVALFPEGTRSHTGDLLPPQKGVSSIALRSDAPVIPVGITGTSRIDRKLHPVKRPLIEVRFGPPVELDDLRTQGTGKHILAEASERVMRAVREQIEISRLGRISHSRNE